MSDTPRTDSFEETYFNTSTSHVDDVFEFVRQLERENAALLKRLEASDGWDDYNSIKTLQRENAALREDKEHLVKQLSEANRLLRAFAPESARSAAIDAARKTP